MNRLDQTDVCANCGAVTWFGQMHVCRPLSAVTSDKKTALDAYDARTVEKARPLEGQNPMPETLARAENPVLDQPPSPARPPAAGTGRSRPRPGFRHPDSARRCAAAFLADGITAADVREDADPGDMLLAELADAMDAPRTVIELDPRHPVIVFPVKPGEDRTEGEAA